MDARRPRATLPRSIAAQRSRNIAAAPARNTAALPALMGQMVVVCLRAGACRVLLLCRWWCACVRVRAHLFCFAGGGVPVWEWVPCSVALQVVGCLHAGACRVVCFEDGSVPACV